MRKVTRLLVVLGVLSCPIGAAAQPQPTGQPPAPTPYGQPPAPAGSSSAASAAGGPNAGAPPPAAPQPYGQAVTAEICFPRVFLVIIVPSEFKPDGKSFLQKISPVETASAKAEVIDKTAEIAHGQAQGPGKGIK